MSWMSMEWLGKKTLVTFSKITKSFRKHWGYDFAGNQFLDFSRPIPCMFVAIGQFWDKVFLPETCSSTFLGGCFTVSFSNSKKITSCVNRWNIWKIIKPQVNIETLSQYAKIVQVNHEEKNDACWQTLFWCLLINLSKFKSILKTANDISSKLTKNGSELRQFTSF